MSTADIIRMAREAGMETHERKGEVRIGSAVLTGGDSTEQVARFAELVATAERRKHQADIERWKGEAATAEKWRGLALAKDGDGRAVQRVQQEAVANFLEISGQYLTNDASREAALAEARAEERGACAQTCEGIYNDPAGNAGYDAYYTRPYLECADAIRARGGQ